MAKVLFGFTQDLSLVLEVLAFHLDSRQNIFTWEMTFENLLEFALWFWKILCHFQQFLLAMALVQILSPNPSLTFGSRLHQIQQVEPPHVIISI